MLTKAIIEEVIDNKHQARVRIPFYNKIASDPTATATQDLYIATICTIPNCDMNYQIGDIVYLGFEDNNINKPVILGQLSRNMTDNVDYANITVDTFTSKVNTFLPSDTTIGAVTPDEIKQLEGIKQNIQFELEILEKRIAKLEEKLNGEV